MKTQTQETQSVKYWNFKKVQVKNTDDVITAKN